MPEKRAKVIFSSTTSDIFLMDDVEFSNLDGQVDGIESLLEVVFLNRGRDV